MQLPPFPSPLKSLKTTITSGVIIFAGLFTSFEIGDRAQAIVVSGGKRKSISSYDQVKIEPPISF
ncbi:hypothetical protein ACE1B6_18790 [Aerosakkonemataceae cyanobacterium BLCC-F154]|uniref:Uncharacterized protein n=1 Tax=Floridaenema fluviatile BLCC-F154 TaxID=3153640 RepID=A0ABV4YEQ2_9CYAN